MLSVLLNKKFCPYQVGSYFTIVITYCFQFSDISELIEMSIVAGNDFTGPVLRNIHIDIQGRNCITSFAEWTKKYRNVENHPTLKMEMVFSSYSNFIF